MEGGGYGYSGGGDGRGFGGRDRADGRMRRQLELMSEEMEDKRKGEGGVDRCRGRFESGGAGKGGGIEGVGGTVAEK